MEDWGEGIVDADMIRMIFRGSNWTNKYHSSTWRYMFLSCLNRQYRPEVIIVSFASTLKAASYRAVY